jgi:hypothetical protein
LFDEPLDDVPPVLVPAWLPAAPALPPVSSSPLVSSPLQALMPTLALASAKTST